MDELDSVPKSSRPYFVVIKRQGSGNSREIGEKLCEVQIMIFSVALVSYGVGYPNKPRVFLVNGEEYAASEASFRGFLKVSKFAAEDLVYRPVDILAFRGAVGAGVAGYTTQHRHFAADRTLE